ncbi:MAG: hypothetical protein NVS4B8_02510 [Herpetosiphon sp.]
MSAAFMNEDVLDSMERDERQILDWIRHLGETTLHHESWVALQERITAYDQTRGMPLQRGWHLTAGTQRFVLITWGAWPRFIA